MNTCSYYLKVFLTIMKANVKQFAQYRFNFLLSTIVNIIWTIIQVTFVNIIFANIPSLNGWSKYEMLLILGIDEIIFPLFLVFSFTSLSRIEGSVIDGTMDYALLKPINTQFYLSFRFINLVEISPVFVGIYLIYYSLQKMSIMPSLLTLLQFGLLLVIGYWILYCLMLIVTSISFKYKRSFHLVNLLLNFTQCMIYPLDIYSGFFKWFVVLIVPIGILVDFPARLLTKGLHISWISYSFLLAFVLGVIAHFMLRWGIRNYTSASS